MKFKTWNSYKHKKTGEVCVIVPRSWQEKDQYYRIVELLSIAMFDDDEYSFYVDLGPISKLEKAFYGV